MTGSTKTLVRRLQSDKATSRLIAELAERTCAGDAVAREALVDYSWNGKFIGFRDHVVAALSERARPTNTDLIPLFRNWLATETDSQSGHRYWSVRGLLQVLGEEAYVDLVRVANNGSMDTDVRAHAVKQLATHSGQAFDARRPTDPGNWHEEDFDLGAVNEWASAGFPKGGGYPVLPRDPALDSPSSRLEVAAASLEKVLARERARSFDPANPSSLLVPSSPEAIALITDRFRLPKNYLEFLQRFSPMGVTVSVRSVQWLRLFGSGDLLTEQRGYSIDGETGETRADWPASMLVIATDGLGDPYTLDLSRASDSDAPVSTAMHDLDTWKFHDVSRSFVAFLERLSRPAGTSRKT